MGLDESEDDVAPGSSGVIRSRLIMIGLWVEAGRRRWDARAGTPTSQASTKGTPQARPPPPARLVTIR